jgi:hypothetical protein
MSKRSTPDPLLKAFFDAYKLNLLAIPRRDAMVGDVYVDTPKGILAPGRVQSLLTPSPKMPHVNTGEPLANIVTTETRALDLKIGLGLLEGFFNAIGATVIAGKIKAAYERKGAGAVRFKLKNATRDSVDVVEFGNVLFDCRLNGKHAFVQRGNKYYVTVGVCRSHSITVAAEESNQNTVTVEASAVKDAVSADGKINVKQEGTGELTYEGPESLAFGVELVEMAFSDTEQRFTLSAMPRPVSVRDPRKKIERQFLGDPKEGNVFVRIKK